MAIQSIYYAFDLFYILIVIIMMLKKNETRQVNISEGKCTCGPWKSSEIPCWHMFDVFKHTDWQYNDLPSHVLNAYRLEEKIY